MTIPQLSAKSVTIARTFPARRARVFKAWTDPGELVQWWGPHGFTNALTKMDVRPGGAFRLVMRSPEGVDYPLKGVYREVKEPELLSYVENWEEHPAEWQALLPKNAD